MAHQMQNLCVFLCVPLCRRGIWYGIRGYPKKWKMGSLEMSATMVVVVFASSLIRASWLAVPAACSVLFWGGVFCSFVLCHFLGLGYLFVSRDSHLHLKMRKTWVCMTVCHNGAGRLSPCSPFLLAYQGAQNREISKGAPNLDCSRECPGRWCSLYTQGPPLKAPSRPLPRAPPIA